jgi:hypothetical protein
VIAFRIALTGEEVLPSCVKVGPPYTRSTELSMHGLSISHGKYKIRNFEVLWKPTMSNDCYNNRKPGKAMVASHQHPNAGRIIKMGNPRVHLPEPRRH